MRPYMRKFEKLRSKKGLLLLYVLFVVLCAWLNLAWADFGEEDTSSVTYGLSNDSTIALEEDSQIRVDFTLLYDAFEGIHVKFEADSAFKDEQIQACLYDAGTGELLAEDIVALKYELVRNNDSGSYIYFTLPADAEEMEGREVYILFTLLGDEIYTIPEFVLSSTSSGASTLTVDGTQSDLNLIFVAYYTVQTGWTQVLASVVFRMILWILAGSLLFGWMYVSMETSPHAGVVVQQSEASPHAGAVVQQSETSPHAGAVVQQQSEQCPHAGSGGQQKSEPCSHADTVGLQSGGERSHTALWNAFCQKCLDRGKGKKLLAYLAVMGLLVAALFYVYEYHIERVMDQKNEAAILEENDGAAYFTLDGRIKNLEQHFLCTENNVTAVILKLLPVTLEENASIQVLVTDCTTGDVLAQEELFLSDGLAEGETYTWTISLDETLVSAKKHDLSVQLTLRNFEQAAVQLLFSRAYQSGVTVIEEDTGEYADDQLYVNGMKDGRTIAVTLECQNTFFLLPMYRVFCVCLLITVSLLYILCFVRKADLTNICPVLILTLGIGMGSVITIYGVPDEPSHIDTAYQLSNELLGIPESGKDGYIYKRADDADMNAEEEETVSISSYERLYRELFTLVEDDTLVECKALSALNNAGRIYYLPQALGMSLGRILGLGTLPMLLLGRLFALIAYAILTTLAVKKLPFGKVSLILIAVLPISLQQSASYSYDSMINGLAFLFVSYSLYVCSEEASVRLRDLAVIVVSGCLMATVKGSVYLPLCLLPLGIFLVKGKSERRKKLLIASATLICMYAFLQGNLTSILSRLSRSATEAVGGSDSTAVYTFGYFLQYPRRLIGMFANTIYKQGDSYLRNLLGGYLSWLDITIPWFVIIGFLLLMLLSAIAHPDERALPGRKKVFWGILAFGSFLLVEISMLFSWTSTDSLYIEGVQGRYFIPFLLLVLLVLRNSFFRTKKVLDRELVFMSGFLNAIVLIQIIQKVVV